MPQLVDSVRRKQHCQRSECDSKRRENEIISAQTPPNILFREYVQLTYSKIWESINPVSNKVILFCPKFMDTLKLQSNYLKFETTFSAIAELSAHGQDLNAIILPLYIREAQEWVKLTSILAIVPSNAYGTSSKPPGQTLNDTGIATSSQPVKFSAFVNIFE
jgi:hypothetical protein